MDFTIAAAAVGAVTIAAALFRRRSVAKSAPRRDPWSVTTLTSPLPEEIVEVLEQAALCYLASLTTLPSTSALEGAIYQPHLSLMNFTFVRKSATQPHEAIVLSTRRNTLKFANLISSPAATLLVHAGSDLSITLVGIARALEEEPERAERLRALHLANNPGSAVFISGDGIAIIEIAVQSARICDAEDRVHQWKATES